MAQKKQPHKTQSGASETSSGLKGDPDVNNPELTIPLVEEHLRVGKEQVKTSLQIHKTVEARQEHLEIPLETQQVKVRRVAKNQMISEPIQIRQEGDTLIIPVVEEVVVLEKHLRLVEEVHITTTREKHAHIEQVGLRREKVTLERVPKA